MEHKENIIKSINVYDLDVYCILISTIRLIRTNLAQDNEALAVFLLIELIGLIIINSINLFIYQENDPSAESLFLIRLFKD